MKREEKIKIVKYVIGSVFAILLAVAAEVQYAYAAGILALLTIQDTKKETIYIAVKRFVVFLVMTGLSVVIFPLAGYHVWAFGIVLIPYLIFCISFNMKEAMTPIAVLCTHYIAAGSCSVSMIVNEFLVLIIGVGSGVLMNLFMPNRQKWLRKYQNNVDEKMIHILREMSVYMRTDNKSGKQPECFDELESILEDLKKEALYYRNNHFWGENDYYYEYMLMRSRQCRILKRIYKDLIGLTAMPEQVVALSDFFEGVAMVFHEDNDVDDLLEEAERLYQSYRGQDLPRNREEFENRAILYHILKDIRDFLEIKHYFVLEISAIAD